MAATSPRYDAEYDRDFLPPAFDGADDDALDDPAYAPLDPNELAALAADGALDAPPPDFAAVADQGAPEHQQYNNGDDAFAFDDASTDDGAPDAAESYRRAP
jgi:hypothetical protein